jgi:hypothetical protein
MHFRVRKHVVQLVRMVYEPDLKRGRAIVVGSVKLAEPVLPPELASQLTPAECAEFDTWLLTQHRTAMLKAELAVLTLPEQMELAASWFARQPDTAANRLLADEICDIWKNLRRTLAQ